MQGKSVKNPQLQSDAFSTPTEQGKSLHLKKTTSNFLVTLTNQSENQKEQSESDDRGALDYEDLSTYSKYKIGEDFTQEREHIYLNFAKILQKKVVAKMGLKTAKANLKAETVKKEKIEAQLEILAKNKQLESEQAKNKIQRELQNLKSEIAFQQELKQSLKSELQAWQNLNQANQEQIKEFPHDIKEQLPEMQKFKQNQFYQKQKITQLFGLQQVFLANIEQIMSEFP